MSMFNYLFLELYCSHLSVNKIYIYIYIYIYNNNNNNNNNNNPLKISTIPH